MLLVPRDHRWIARWLKGSRVCVRRGRGANGFTLVELLAVMSIILALIAFGIAGIIGAKQRAAIARAKSELALLVQALEDYKRHYGDYPETGAAGQASQTVTALIGANQAQSLLFNALAGVYGPKNFTTRINGPSFIDISKFTLETPLTTAQLSTFGIPTGSPPAKPLLANSFLDPWGRRYLYYYKTTATTTNWSVGPYVLYSAGPDGAQTAPNPNTGLYTGTTQTTGTNADNLYADKLP